MNGKPEFDMDNMAIALCQYIEKHGGTIKLEIRESLEFRKMLWQIWNDGFHCGCLADQEAWEANRLDT